jgi:ribosome-associated protein
VNKVSTAVELCFDAARSPSLPAAVRARLMRLAGRRLTKDGVLVIRAERFRTQEQVRRSTTKRRRRARPELE